MKKTKFREPVEGLALYNSKIIKTFIRLIRSKYGYLNIGELLAYAGMEAHQVEDDGHWFSQSQTDRFHERLVQLTGNPSIARDAGRYNASPEGLGLMSRYVFGLAGPGKVFEAIGKIAGSLTRSSVFEARRISATEIEIIVTPKEGVQEKPYQCENRIGYFEAIVSGFNNRAPKIEHTECIFKGGSACRYHISWRKSKAAALRIARLGTALAGLSAWFLVGLSGNIRAATGIAILGLFLLLALSLIRERCQKRELDSVIDHLRSTTERFLDDAERNYNHALMVNEIGHALSATKQIDTMLEQVMDILSLRLDYDRGIILLADEEKRMLEFRAGFGYTPALFDEVRKARFSLYKPQSRGVFVVCYRERKPFLINDVAAIEHDISNHSLEFMLTMGSKSFICCPILYEDQCLGVLAVDNLESKRPLVESDINLLMGIAPEIGITVNSALLTEEREIQFRSILRTLAASIDARDNLTAGHSERVTEYALAICDELHLPPELSEVIRVAAQLHDYGKIGIKDSILKKRGPLSGKEREEIKTHAVKTQDILSRINFSGAYQQVPFIAGSHHERLDGTGYPRGLKGDEIPLGARILAVADFFEAISARRHYHEPQPLEAAIAMLKSEIGHHLDETAVHALLKALMEGRVRGPNIVNPLGGAATFPGGIASSGLMADALALNATAAARESRN
ncbi:MAG TPA: phosphohydrolase [Spirochaetaceae bacterium]|jgi:HD-GYP domain-containing protein (c-di-GMP phosphodiesterase class II)|nr:phosphohydrolase [Spirochaetaceae bacterium]